MKKISALAGIVIIIVVAVALFGGVFAYQHYFSNPKSAVVSEPVSPQPKITFTANPSTAIYGTSTTLSWSVTNATSCGITSNPIDPNLAGSWSGNIPMSETLNLPITPAKTITYTITCTNVAGAGASNSASVTVTVNPQTSAQHSITIISPNGGEKWQVGKTYKITWNAKNIGGIDDVAIATSGESSVSTETSKNYEILMGTNFAKSNASRIGVDTVIKDIDPGVGYYSWTIPTNFTFSKYNKIYITGHCNNNNGCGGEDGDSSASYFSIVAP